MPEKSGHTGCGGHLWRKLRPNPTQPHNHTHTALFDTAGHCQTGSCHKARGERDCAGGHRGLHDMRLQRGMDVPR